MDLPKTVLLPPEAIGFLDQLMAKHLLVLEMSQILEFLEYWNRACAVPTVVIDFIRPKLREVLAAMSPAGRGALAASTDQFFALSL